MHPIWTGAFSLSHGLIIIVVRNVFAGEPSLGVLPIDPLRLTKLGIAQGNGPVSIDLEFRDLDMTGLKNLRLTEAK